MRRNIPLNSLRAFEATGRHKSFTLAADELCVSQGAISRHVHNIEQHLGVSLFHRTTRQLALSDAGSTLLKDASNALDIIENSVARLVKQNTSLNLQVVPTFAMHWLIPRFSNFDNQNGDSLISITTRSTVSTPDLDENNFDAGILYGSGDWPNMHVEMLFKERLTPVCSPNIKRKIFEHRQMNQPFDFELLHNSVDRCDWNDWQNHFPIENVDPDTGITFETMDNAISAAIAGHGITIGDLSLIEDKIKAKQLVTIDQNVIHSKKGYYFVCPKSALQQSKIQNFRKILFSQLELTE